MIVQYQLGLSKKLLDRVRSMVRPHPAANPSATGCTARIDIQVLSGSRVPAVQLSVDEIDERPGGGFAASTVVNYDLFIRAVLRLRSSTFLCARDRSRPLNPRRFY